MSAQAPDTGPPKKAVHVKWAGKTIALGTFPSSEADEKCARAKALTRAWRSTMRPKPTRDWVMNELERLGVRVVSGKLGRKADEEEGKEGGSGGSGGGAPPPFAPAPMENFSQERVDQQRRASLSSLGMGTGNLGGGAGMTAPPGQPANQHYEMLKLHHMNLLQELHETTMMMNMYQQQQLQQEQLRLQQQQGGGNDQLGMMPQQRKGSLGGGMDPLFGNGGGFGQRGSLGLGTGFGQRSSLGLGSSAFLNSSQLNHPSDGRIDPSQGAKDAAQAQAALAGLKRTPDDGNDHGAKRSKHDHNRGGG